MPRGGAALMQGFEVAFYVLAVVAAVAALVSALLIESKPAVAEEPTAEAEEVVFEAAA